VTRGFIGRWMRRLPCRLGDVFSSGVVVRRWWELYSLNGSGAVRSASFPRYGDAHVVPDIEATHIDASDDVLWIDHGRDWLLDTKRKALQKAPAILTFILRQVPAGFVESDRAQITPRIEKGTQVWNLAAAGSSSQPCA
jgi:hypothetical protein